MNDKLEVFVLALISPKRLFPFPLAEIRTPDLRCQGLQVKQGSGTANRGLHCKGEEGEMLGKRRPACCGDTEPIETFSCIQSCVSGLG